MNGQANANRHITGLRLVTSNRMERLVERLAELVREPLASPLAPEIIVVQSRGMERWVSMQLARLNGISANVRFPFPNAFLEEAFQRLRPAPAGSAAFEPDRLAFRIMQALAGDLDHPDCEALKTYLEDDPHQLKRFQFSRKLADLFDHYSVYRADMLLRWEEGKDEPDPTHRWQARLWRQLVAEAGSTHRARTWKDSLHLLNRLSPGTADLPERVSLFGISYLPPSYLECFQRLARLVRVNLFLLNPCREYWGDILSDRELQRMERRDPAMAEKQEEFHVSRGNRLLSSLGALGRDFFDQMAASGAVQEERFDEPEDGSVLGRLQADILNLRDPAPSPHPESVPDDPSIRIQVCHSPMREMEVLHDQILAMFEEDPELLPSDIVVMTPDIDAYAAYISSVFGSQSDESRGIPFSIADRGSGGQSRVEAAFSSLLDLKDSRLGAASVLGLLEHELIRRKFCISEADVAVIAHWVRQTGIRWGRDETSRRSLGLPASGQNTWKAGIERMMLGYALSPESGGLFQGILAFDAMEGSETRILGDFLHFCDAVFTLARRLVEPQRLRQWQAVLTQLLGDYCEPPDAESEYEMRRVGGILAELGGFEESVGFELAVPLEVVRHFLKGRLAAERLGRGFLSGGVTFCAMLPMRTIPFKVVALVGMNYDAFPRDLPAPAFDLMAQNPRPGDRSRRNDDKYLFLEALLSARRRLCISFVGRSIQDNSPLPPSVLVSELADTLEKGYAFARDRIFTEHRLQVFSAEYFREGSGLFSYSPENLMACAARGGERAPAVFFRRPLALKPEEAAEWRELTPERLQAFFSNPARFLVKNRLGIHLEEAPGALAESEPFVLDPLTRYRMADALLKRRMAGSDPADLFESFRASGELPHGTAGEYLFGRLSAEVDRYVSRLDRILPPMDGRPIEFERELDGFRLTARMTELSARGCVQIRYAEVGAKDFIKGWIKHLFLCIGGAGQGSWESLIIGKDAAWQLAPVADAAGVLSSLLAFYRRGLTEPIPFFPVTSLEFVEACRAPGVPDRRALAKARRAWVGRDEAPGEGRDPYNRICYGRREPLDEDFKAAAVAVFQPLFAHRQRLAW
jgi:exodeoxyribonuclease V gamma subunit